MERIAETLLGKEDAVEFLRDEREAVDEVFRGWLAHEVDYAALVGMVAEGKIQVWRTESGTATALTRFHTNPNGTAECCILAAQGAMDDVLSLTDDIEDLAAKMDLDAVIVNGRRGWERVGASRGYAFDHITLRKEL